MEIKLIKLIQKIEQGVTLFLVTPLDMLPKVFRGKYAGDYNLVLNASKTKVD